MTIITVGEIIHLRQKETERKTTLRIMHGQIYIDDAKKLWWENERKWNYNGGAVIDPDQIDCLILLLEEAKRLIQY